MDDTTQPFTVEHFTASMLESGRLHTEMYWVVARTRSGEQPTWLGGFGDRAGKHPVWIASVGEAVTYDREGAEAARLRCTDLPDHEDVLYALCHLRADADTSTS